MKGTSKTAKKDGDYLSTLARGLSVLRAFTKERPEMTLSETAAATQLSPAVARRCLHTLVELGYVGMQGIDPDVAWAKLGSLAEGARIATDRLF